MKAEKRTNLPLRSSRKHLANVSELITFHDAGVHPRSTLFICRRVHVPMPADIGFLVKTLLWLMCVSITNILPSAWCLVDGLLVDSCSMGEHWI